MRFFREAHPGNLLLLLVLGGGLYATVLIGPHYVDHMNVREAVDTAFAQARTSTDEQLRALIRERTSDMGTHPGEDEFGNPTELPGLGLTDEQILITRDLVDDSVHIEVDYEREVRFVPTSYVRVLSFQAAKGGVPPAGWRP